ncbi:hypothetical protein EW026_g62 [Hermanssonia centrifuga]|uniref:ARID domain-containing protein n=1 Tax=Hermanssonia centrifuga TaxID=98765 RepID=A0A4S4KW10_9APHY|nr:hypothetical protein EW026_g62 [Hermanssonia centrifuga]
MQQQSQQQRKRSFLQGVASIMAQRGTPLPPALTGAPYQGFDPATSMWRSLEVSGVDVGVVRLAGKDVDLFKLWALVQHHGGSTKLSQQVMWGQLLPQFDLPEQYMQPNGQPQSSAVALERYYSRLIGPFEEMYRKNIYRDRAMQAARNQPGAPGTNQGRPPGMTGTFPPVGSLPAVSGNNGLGMMGQPITGGSALPTEVSLGGIGGPQFPASQMISQAAHMSQQQPISGMSGTPDSRVDVAGTDSLSAARQDVMGIISSASQDSELNGTASEQDVDGRKRKMEEGDEANGKRVRHKTGESSDLRSSVPPSGLTPHGMNITSRPLRQPSRRRIEYIPLAREVDTAGGRDLDAIQSEFATASQRPLKDLNEWGAVDVEALTMSIRSRISTELSYALTTFTILTLMRIKDSGFPVVQAPDLLDELLDLIEDVAFEGMEDIDPDDFPNSSIITHRHLMNAILEEGSQPFASLKPKQGLRDPGSGPQQRPGDVLLTALNIVRNLSLSAENQDYLARHSRLLGIILRLCSLKNPVDLLYPAPLSPALSLNDLILARKDVIYILVNISATVQLSSTDSPSSAVRNARRAFDLLASYLVDPVDAVPPLQCLLLNGAPTHIHASKPPSTLDTALEAFTRFTHPDDNRLVFARAIPPEWLWCMIEALVHRLPVTDHDFQVMMRAEWLAYLERIVLSLYSIGFLAPPKVKKRVKTDRQLAFPTVMLRLIRKLTIGSPADARPHFVVSVRRAIEVIKLIDDAGDSFDSSSSTMPTLAFGMGYGEHGETRVEKGMGLLSGHQDEVTWGLMMSRDVDDQMFSELSSLVRVEISS